MSCFFLPLFLAKNAGCFTPLSFRTGIVRNPSGRDSNLPKHSPPCEVDPVQSIYRMTAESDETRMLEKGPKKGHPLFPFFLAKKAGCFTPLSFRTGNVRNPSGRDSNLSEHSPPCEVDPVQSIYRMTAESDETRMLEKGPKKTTHFFQSRNLWLSYSS